VWLSAEVIVIGKNSTFWTVDFFRRFCQIWSGFISLNFATTIFLHSQGRQLCAQRQFWRSRSLCLCPPVTGWPSYTPRLRVPFPSPSATLRSTAGLFQLSSTMGKYRRNIFINKFMWKTNAFSVFSPIYIHTYGHTGDKGKYLILVFSTDTRRKPAPKPLCLPQIPRDRTGVRTPAAAVGSRRLTDWG
jgi:hypothetical protein